MPTPLICVWCGCVLCVCLAALQAKEHVESNVGLAALPQLTPKLWAVVHQQMQDALSKQLQLRQQ